MKTVIGLSNFFKSNTPQLMEVIGNVAFLLGLIAGLPAAINLVAAEAEMAIVIPAFILKSSKIASLVLIGIKAFTKFLGQKEIVKTDA